MEEPSPLQEARLNYQPALPRILSNVGDIVFEEGTPTKEPSEALKQLFPKTWQQSALKAEQGHGKPCGPLNVGVVLSGGQAAGGHNVIGGLLDGIKSLNPDSHLYGFLGGPSGIINGEYIEITEEIMAPYRNQGGFDLIGSGRTKIETVEDFERSGDTCRMLDLDGLVVIGGDDSNTNAALLAEYCISQGMKTKVIGAPKTIDGDLRSDLVEISFGHDTACKTYSDLIGNIARDALSAKKYYHFIKLMGRSASHIALECALQTQPNITLIGEEVAKEKKTLAELRDEICRVISKRADKGKNYGVVLIPEGIVEFIPEVRTLISELNKQLRPDSPLSNGLAETDDPEARLQLVREKLSDGSKSCFDALPEPIALQLLLDRDPHGNVQVSKIETERLFISIVKEELGQRKKSGTFKGSFSAQPHFLGYEGRSCLPSNFDAQYCFALGTLAAAALASGRTGYMVSLQRLALPVEDWEATMVPIVSMMHFEMRSGASKPVIEKALVDLEGPAFRDFKKLSPAWAVNDRYRYPGPIQFAGDRVYTDAATMTLRLEQGHKAILASS